jgi:hypothetical protein
MYVPPRNRVARLYPHSLGSLFIASYDSQGYGGGILTYFHTRKKAFYESDIGEFQ